MLGVVAAHNTGHTHRHHGQERAEYWANEWIVKVLCRDYVEDVALERGCINLGEVRGFDYYFYFRCLDFPEVGREEFETTKNLDRDLRVHWAEQQFDKVRVKRGVRRDNLGLTERNSSGAAVFVGGRGSFGQSGEEILSQDV